MHFIYLTFSGENPFPEEFSENHNNIIKPSS
jgi:hypothetical protein